MEALPTTPIEGLINNADAMSEHIAAHIGLSSLLKGEIGDNYRPTASPFYSIAKNVQGGEDPEIEVTKSNAKLGMAALKNIEKGTASVFGGDALPIDDSHEKGFHELYEKHDELGSNPELLLDHLAKQTAPLAEHAPDVAAGLSKVVGNAMGALQGVKPSNLPKAPLDNPAKPSASQVAKYNDTAKLLENPLLLLKKMQDGTLTIHHVQTVGAVYPSVLDTMKQGLMKNLIKHQAAENGPLPASIRLSLSRVFGQNMDSSLAGLGQNQATLAGIGMANKMQQMPQAKPSKSGMGKMNIATADKTKAQQSLERNARS